MQPKALQGFKVLPLQFSENSTTQHQLFIKEHSVREQCDDKPADRTLFVLNVPPYVTESSFKYAFSIVGAVTNVIFQNKPTSSQKETIPMKLTGFRIAYVIFDKPDSIENALNLTILGPISTKTRPVLTGIQKWVKEYNNNIHCRTKLEENVNNFIETFDKNEEKERKQQELSKDDGGWTLVTKKGRNPGLSRKESVANKMQEKNDKGVKRKQLDDFYTFQKRESKMKRLEEMRKKYELDKKKIEAMKQTRKFKPL